MSALTPIPSALFTRLTGTGKTTQLKLNHLLLAVLLLLTQSGALTHAIDHLQPDADEVASHVCALCIAAQGLAAPLESAAPGMALPAASFAPPVGEIVAVAVSSSVSPRARAPPHA